MRPLSGLKAKNEFSCDFVGDPFFARPCSAEFFELWLVLKTKKTRISTSCNDIKWW